MPKLARKIVEILDGTPADYGKPQKGQSLVEMAFITPILIVLIAGIVEIGWLANNYLTLQEVTKVGARRGTVLVGDGSPFSWNSAANILPESRTGGLGTSIDPDAGDSGFADREELRDAARSCGSNAETGFYNEILCTMKRSMDPLELDTENGVDDIAISVFAIQRVYNHPEADGGDVDLEALVPQIPRDEYVPGWIPVIVGRYPSNTNECNVLADGSVPTQELERDPFDYINDSLHPTTRTFPDPELGLPATISLDLELSGYDDVGSWPERQRGFVLYGQHHVDTVEDAAGVERPVDCYGSEWSIYEVEDLLEVPTFEMTADEVADAQASDPEFDVFEDPETGVLSADEQGRYLPNQGLILVELWWQHHLLLDLPVFSPVLQILGDTRTTLYTWAAFPVPSVKPNIQYTLIEG